MSSVNKIVRIGCGSGFWGDSAVGPRQLVESGEIDYLVLDYLAEITMSILARSRAKDEKLGYATDFPEIIASLAQMIKARGIKVVCNAGGVNPRTCQAVLQKKLQALGVDLKIGIVLGDDLLTRADELRSSGVSEMFDGSAVPTKPWSINAYLGAEPIAAALAAGADIVLTGRCVDSALALGPLMHEFGWRADDYDRLAAGSLAGHVIECGCQATGGISTDWRKVVDDWDDMGFPIAECRADGSFVLTKPTGSGGRVSPETVAEQIVYEIGDPGSYQLPDVVCDFQQVTARQVVPDRVEVIGARGYAPTSEFKVSATWQDGYRCTGTMMIGGVDAPEKAQRVAAALLKRTRRLMAGKGHADYRRCDVEVLGAEANWGANARANTREVILKIALQHDEKAALEFFSREIFATATSMAQGITGFAGGRPSITPLVRLFSFLVEKASVPIAVEVEGTTVPLTTTTASSGPQAPGGKDTVGPLATAPASGHGINRPLLALAYGRSGDKGNKANIGVIARRPEFLPLLRTTLTAKAVKRYFAHFADGEVERFEIPGLGGFNFVLHDALGGGGVASLRYDPQGKMLAQILMDFPLVVPKKWFQDGWVD